MIRLIRLISLVLLFALGSVFEVSANRNLDQMYHPSRFLEFYSIELRELNGLDPVLAANAVYTISRNQSPDIAVFLEKLWLKQKVLGVKVRYELFEDQNLKLVLSRALIERKVRLKEVLGYVFSTVDFNSVSGQYRTIEALRESNDNQSLEYLRKYSVVGNRSIAEHSIPGLVHWAFYGNNTEKAKSELKIVKANTPYIDIVRKYEIGYEKSAARK